MSYASTRRGLPWIEIAVIGLAVAIVAAFAGLIPLGTWRVDEYHDFGLYRLRGWSYFFERLLTWSPRPLSEVIAASTISPRKVPGDSCWHRSWP